jgi:hypothetical protein
MMIALWWAPHIAEAQVEVLVPELSFVPLVTGSTVGPGGDIYVTEGVAGNIYRVDPATGDYAQIAADPLPLAIIPLGGAVDIAFIGSTAYVLTTLVNNTIFGGGIGAPENGIYRLNKDGSWSLVADLGAYSANNPPDNLAGTPDEWEYFVAEGVHYAMEVYRGGFLVTDGHHNRVLYVTTDGEISEFIAFGNIVPTGLAVSGETVYMARSGAVPHIPDEGKVVAFGPRGPAVTEVASGAPLLVDVEFGRGRTIFALAQGIWGESCPPSCFPGDPPTPNTGSLVRVNNDGTFTEVATGLNWPSSMEIIGNTAYVVTLTGGIYRIDNIAEAPFGKAKGRR